MMRTPPINILTQGHAQAPLFADVQGRCFDEAWDTVACARLLALPGAFGLLAYWQGSKDPCGFVLARVAGEEGEILSIGVEPLRRGHGVATQLLQRAMALMAAGGGGSLVLEVAEDNEAALRLYGRLGFVAVGRRPEYYKTTNGRRAASVLRAPIPKPHS